MPEVKINEKYEYEHEDLVRLSNFYCDKNIDNENVIWAPPCSKNDSQTILKPYLDNLEKGQKLLVPFNTGDHWVGMVFEKTEGNNVNFTMMDSLKIGSEQDKALKQSWLNWFKDKFKSLIFNERKESINTWKQEDKTTCGAWAIENLRREGYQQGVNAFQPKDKEIRTHHCNIIAEQGLPEKQLNTEASKAEAIEKSHKYDIEHGLLNDFNKIASLELKKQVNEELKDKATIDEIRNVIVDLPEEAFKKEDLATINNLKNDIFDKDEKDILQFKEQLNNLVNPAPSLDINKIHLEDFPTRDLANIIHENATPEFKKLLNDVANNPSQEKWNNLDGKLTSDLDKAILENINSQGYNIANKESLARLNQFVNHFDNIEDKNLSENIVKNFKNKQSAIETAIKISPPPATGRGPNKHNALSHKF